jgi:hypothetical protein
MVRMKEIRYAYRIFVDTPLEGTACLRTEEQI